ncbi:MAG: hypothetical protein IJJ47_09750 [Methanosphaera sp.]|nr:hypothetical protein [Methanosphaera sp.]
MKNLFHSFIFFKSDDESNFHTWINENVTYTNGVLQNHSTLTQTGELSFNASIVSPNYRLGTVSCKLVNGVEGQTVQFISSYVNMRTITDGEGYCVSSSGRFNRGETVTVIVEPLNVDGVDYSGCTLTCET